MNRRPKVVLKYSRLTFVRDFIEPLGSEDVFRVETPEGAFEMSKSEFHAMFPSVLESRSYKDDGYYNYKVPPHKADLFRVDGQQVAKQRKSSLVQYPIPEALRDACTEAAYKRWLHRKAAAHVKRDKKRWKMQLSVADYKKAIHAAVHQATKHDSYTGEFLDWTLISKYDNERSKQGGTTYKKTLAMLPTVDHAGDVPGDMNFRICSWRTNDAKSDMTLEEFIELCKKVLGHHGRNQVL